MSAYRVSLANRRMILLAVLSLIASLLTVNFNAPLANAAPGDVTVSETSVTVTEGGATATYAITLGSVPAADVYIDVSSTGEANVSPSTLTIDASNWDTGTAVVTVTANDDLIVDGQTSDTAVNANTVSTDLVYSDKPVANVDITVNDNDVAGVNVSTTTVDVTEESPGVGYTITLNSEPIGTVNVGVVIDTSEATVSTLSVDLNSVNWSTGASVTVDAADDDIDDGNASGTISHDVLSAPSDPAYLGLSAPDVSVTAIDNDTAGITVTESDSSTDVTEGGATDTYDVRLNSEPSVPVTVAITAGGSEATTLPTALNFDSGNWSTNQTVTVTATDDAVADGPTTEVFTHSSSGGEYGSAPDAFVTANVSDDDAVGATVSPTSMTVTEAAGGTHSATYDISLNSQPTGVVTVDVTNPDPTEFSVSPTSLTFTTTNYGDTQAVTVTAVDDLVADGDSVNNITHSASGGGYNGVVPAPVEVTVTDDDVAGVTVSPTTATATEGGATGSYSVVLDTQPTGAVGVTLTPDPTGGVEATAASTLTSLTVLTFDAGTWNTPQSVTVTAVDDLVADGTTSETITHVATGGGYTGVTVADVDVTVTDDDVAGVTVSPTTATATEGGATGSYSVVLDTQPTGAVGVTLTPDPTGGVEATAASTLTSLTVLTFDAGTWNTPQFVTVTAVDDLVADGTTSETITHVATGGGYTGVTVADVDVTVTDDETPGISLTGTATVAEPSGTGTFGVSLTTEPSGTVSVAVVETSDEFSVTTGATLTFTTLNWATSQPVGIRATDDDVADGQQFGTVTLTATGGGYTGSDAVMSTVTIDDDDVVGITTAEPGGTSVVEGGATDTYTVVLDTEPTGTVTVAVDVAGSEVAVNKTTLTFTPLTWDAPQTVTVTAVNDSRVDGSTSDAITHSASGADYEGEVGPNVTVSVTDNDVAGVTIVESGGSTDVIEGGDTDTYTVVLDAEPNSDVVVSVLPDAQSTVSPAALTFTPSNWNSPQGVTVTAVPDGIDEIDPHPGLIAHTTASGDTDFHGLTVDTLTINVGDIDALLVTIDGPSIGAPGLTSTFTAMVNAGGTGTITYDWQAFYEGTLFDSGNEASFGLTPTGGGSYTILVTVGDSKGENPAVFIQFKVLGDVAGSVFVNDIVWLAEEGITRGCNPPANDEFCPNDIVTREQMAAFLVRFLGLKDDGGGNTFVDDNGSIFEDDIAKLAQAGITRGCNPPTNDRFCPTDRVTREQMAAFLVRALKLTDDGGGNTFTDDNGSIFEDDIAKLAAAGITRGCNPPTNTQFCPTDFVTRGQMAAFLRRADAILNP